MKFNSSCKITHNQDRLQGAFKWLAVTATKSSGQTVTPDMIRDALIEEHGPLAEVSYAVLAGTDVRGFFAALKEISGVKVPGGMDKVFGGFFRVWQDAFQCDTCHMLAVLADDDRQGVKLVTGALGCRFNCRGTFCNTMTETEIQAWPDGTMVSFTDSSYSHRGSNYPLHHDDLVAEFKGKRFLVSLEKAEVSIPRFFRYCVETEELALACNFIPSPRGLWDFFFKNEPMDTHFRLINSAIEKAKNWKEGGGEKKGEVTERKREGEPSKGQVGSLWKTPLDWTDPQVWELRDLLVNAYSDSQSIQALLRTVQPDLMCKINFNQASEPVWNKALEVIASSGLWTQFFGVIIGDKNVAGFRPQFIRLRDAR
ncbi:hypothetical protein EPO05_07425 [Patescibacteria group bacterium]|nr:MAG: hypothetical protein EPO05_07425 [Patescibacteria group bacterium]